jgi:arsenite methyltransferase
MRYTDLLIKDVQTDLNVYLNTLPDGTKRVPELGSGYQQKSCCASPPAEGAACCGPENKASGCDPSENEAMGCCGTPVMAAVVEHDFEKLVAQLGSVDLNEWVGKY